MGVGGSRGYGNEGQLPEAVSGLDDLGAEVLLGELGGSLEELDAAATQVTQQTQAQSLLRALGSNGSAFAPPPRSVGCGANGHF